MSHFRKTSNKIRPTHLGDGFASLDNISKLNQLNYDNNRDHPSTPIVPSSSRNIFMTDKKPPRSLVGSPLPFKTKGDSYGLLCSSTNSMRKITKVAKLRKDTKNVGSINRLEKDEIEKNKLRLESVYGFTIQNNAAVALDPMSGIIAFPSGCVVVGYNAKRRKQIFIHNTVKNPITALAFSRDGKLLATGESGKLPKVRIWNMKDHTQIHEFNGHYYRIGAIVFSPSSKFVVSVGSQEDMTINVWEISSSLKMATSRVTSKVNAISFSDTGRFFVTVGVRHVRFWYLDNRSSKSKTTIVLSGRNAILRDFMNNTYNDVACCSLVSNSSYGQLSRFSCSSLNSSNLIQTYVYAISQSGHLMQFNEQRCLERWVELRTPKASCIDVCDMYIIIGCAKGIILVFDTVSLNHLSTLPTTHFLGININTGNLDQSVQCNHDRYPDVIAGKYDNIHSRITAFYSDHSLYVWDIRDIDNPIKTASHLYHSGGVWAVEPVPLSYENDGGIFESSSFITCSDDDTVRFWNLNDFSSRNKDPLTKRVSSNSFNDFSKELLWIIYSDSYLTHLTENDRPLEKSIHQSIDSNAALKHGIRSIKISPDYRHLATADREGNLRFYSLVDFTEFYSIAAHNGEILSIDYFQSKSVPNLMLFCSASRDRVIHVMDPGQAYTCIQTIDDHSGAIFSAKLVETQTDQEIRLVSCGMDKSLLFRILQPDESGQTAQFFLNQHLVGKHSQYDMIITPNNRYAAVACQDRQVRIYNLVTGKQRKSYRGTLSDDGNLLRCAIDPTGTYLATAGSDKSLHLLNFTTGEILASVTGHSEVASGLCFLHDLKHLVSVSCDKCIFVWRLPKDVTITMRHAMKELGSPNCAFMMRKGSTATSTCGTVTPPRMSDDMNVGSSNISICTNASGDNMDAGHLSTFRFSVSALPSWAQRKFSRRDSNTFMQVNVPADLYAGMSMVLERTEENIFSEDVEKKEEIKSRRMSFLATEKVVRDDDSDNIDDEDSEWNYSEKDCFDRSMDLETISQQMSTEDEIDDDDVVEDNFKSSKSQINKKIDTEKYIIQMNTEYLRHDNDDFMRQLSEPRLDDTFIDKSADSFDDKNVLFLDSPFLDEGGDFKIKRRSSLTTRYLSNYLPGSDIDTFGDNITEESWIENRKHNLTKPVDRFNVPVDVKVKELINTPPVAVQQKCSSQDNVNKIAGVRRTSESNNQSSSNHINLSALHTSSCKRDFMIKDTKTTFRTNLSRTPFNRSISTTSMPASDHLVDSRHRSNTLKSQQSTETTTIKSHRPKWADSKKKINVRKTCPVDIKDIKSAFKKHSTVTSSSETTEDISNAQLKGLCDEITPDIKLDRGKEHVIDELEDVAIENVDNKPILNEVTADTIKSAELPNKTIGSDEWIDDLCLNHSTHFLASIVSKLLHRILNTVSVNSVSNSQQTSQLLTDLEQMRRELSSGLGLSTQTLCDDVNESLIKEIGAKIVDEVNRRLSESR